MYIYTHKQVTYGLPSGFDCRNDKEGSKELDDSYQLKIWSVCCNIPHTK